MKSLLGKSLSTLSIAAVLLALPASAAVDMFLDLGAGIPGESTDKVHSKQVDVLAWSWSMSNPSTTPSVAGKASFQDISVTKYVDKSSPLLMLRCANGAHIPTATLFVRKAGTIPIEYIKIIMTEVIVTSVATGGSSGEDRLTENISLNFAKVEFDYVPTKADGTPDTMIPFKWDITGNVAF